MSSCLSLASLLYSLRLQKRWLLVRVKSRLSFHLETLSLELTYWAGCYVFKEDPFKTLKISRLFSIRSSLKKWQSFLALFKPALAVCCGGFQLYALLHCLAQPVSSLFIHALC
jgi:hypothetical protein